MLSIAAAQGLAGAAKAGNRSTTLPLPVVPPQLHCAGQPGCGQCVCAGGRLQPPDRRRAAQGACGGPAVAGAGTGGRFSCRGCASAGGQRTFNPPPSCLLRAGQVCPAPRGAHRGAPGVCARRGGPGDLGQRPGAHAAGRAGARGHPRRAPARRCAPAVCVCVCVWCRRAFAERGSALGSWWLLSALLACAAAAIAPPSRQRRPLPCPCRACPCPRPAAATPYPAGGSELHALGWGSTDSENTQPAHNLMVRAGVGGLVRGLRWPTVWQLPGDQGALRRAPARTGRRPLIPHP